MLPYRLRAFRSCFLFKVSLSYLEKVHLASTGSIVAASWRHSISTVFFSITVPYCISKGKFYLIHLISLVDLGFVL